MESYRSEMNKWQSEADVLRQQLSENRMLLTKGNISLIKELQDKDDKIHELTLSCQQLQVRNFVNLSIKFIDCIIIQSIIFLLRRIKLN